MEASGRLRIVQLHRGGLAALPSESDVDSAARTRKGELLARLIRVRASDSSTCAAFSQLDHF